MNTVYTHDSTLISFRVEHLNALAFHLYGFAEQADQFSDTATATHARSIAEQVLSDIEFKDTLVRRIDAQGIIKIVPADIPGFENI